MDKSKKYVKSNFTISKVDESKLQFTVSKVELLFTIFGFCGLYTIILTNTYSLSWLHKPCSHNMRSAGKKNSANISTIAFGSCASSNDGLPIFSDITADVIVFLGDNVYADTDQPFYMHWMYNRLSCMPEFQGMVDRAKHVLAIWDDHDFGSDNIGAENPIKYESQSIFLDFWRIPQNSERRRGDGVYGSYQFNMQGEGTLSIIMPDLQFFRGPLTYCENSNTTIICPTNDTMIGDIQWKWLEDTVSTSQKLDKLTIIASSLQFGHSANGYESWNNFPSDRARLYSLLDPSKSLVISGDVHWGEVSVFDGIVDVTSSGFSCVDPNILPNYNRIGNAVPKPNYGFIDLKEKTVSIYGLHNRLLLLHSF